MSGAGAPDDASRGYGDDSAITDIPTESSNGAFAGGASSGGISGGADSGGAFDESVGGIGGAASVGGGAAGAGDPGAEPTNPGLAGSPASAGGPGRNAPPSLLFSEYVEGSSANKALEIAALERSVLDDCKVGVYFNGKAQAEVVASLSGVLEGGQVLTLCTSTLKAKLGKTCNQVGNLSFNGDDAVAISCAGKILDVIGQVAVDPGSAWGKGASTTLDHTLRRKCSVSVGRVSGASAFEPSSEWQAFPVDTFSGLGSRGC